MIRFALQSETPTAGRPVTRLQLVKWFGKFTPNCLFNLRKVRFDTSTRGNRNTGHEFGTDLSEEDRKALIEYLKTL
jgi:hypothetical protein